MKPFESDSIDHFPPVCVNVEEDAVSEVTTEAAASSGDRLLETTKGCTDALSQDKSSRATMAQEAAMALFKLTTRTQKRLVANVGSMIAVFLSRLRLTLSLIPPNETF